MGDIKRYTRYSSNVIQESAIQHTAFGADAEQESGSESTGSTMVRANVCISSGLFDLS